MTPTRTCGDCTVCCAYLRINHAQLKKPGLTPCPRLRDSSGDGYNGGGCSIYGEYPSTCRDYRCSWLLGEGAEEDRPDLCGVLIDTVLPIDNCLQAKPIRKGAGDSELGDAAIHRMSRSSGKPVLVARFPETQMVRVVGRGAE